MAQDLWTAIDDYYDNLFIPDDPTLTEALESSQAAGLPPMQVTSSQGKFLHLLAKMCQAKTILEIGTLGGYSTIWLARALPKDGKLVSLEGNPHHAQVAWANISNAGAADQVEIRLGQAMDSLAQLVAEGAEPFDFIFFDADKPNYTKYLTWALKLSRPGTIVFIDNVVRQGGVIDPNSSDPGVQGIREFNKALAATPGLSVSAVQTVGRKGYDGFSLIIVE